MPKPLPLLHFNSTMVRLKVVGATMQPDNTLFQFHYGTIKSRTPGYPGLAYFLISIPLWYD